MAYNFVNLDIEIQQNFCRFFFVLTNRTFFLDGVFFFKLLLKKTQRPYQEGNSSFMIKLDQYLQLSLWPWGPSRSCLTLGLAVFHGAEWQYSVARKKKKTWNMLWSLSVLKKAVRIALTLHSSSSTWFCQEINFS